MVTHTKQMWVIYIDDNNIKSHQKLDDININQLQTAQLELRD